jgi:general secretion pathway protein B
VSFILDALRKSEHARQQQTGPALAEVPVATPKPRTNTWAVALVALLLVNLVAVGVLMLRRSQPPAAETVAAPVATAAPAPAPAAPPSPSTTTPVARAPVSAGVTATAPAPASERRSLADEVGGSAGTGRQDPVLASGAASVPAGPPAVRSTQATGTAPRRGSVVYAPVPEAADLPYTPPVEAPARRAPAAESLPSAEEVVARGSVPPMHLDLHVYATAPQQRFIFVNSRKYREGDTLQEGPVVEQITQDGAVLNLRGSRFKLTSR